MKKNLKHLSSLLVLLFCNVCFATPDPPVPAATPVPTGVPIDSSLYVLVLVGIAYVLIEFKRRQRNAQFKD